MRMKQLIISAIVAILISACQSKRMRPAHPPFVALDSSVTGITFSNDLKYNQEFNLFKYIYFYNGGGIGAGDFNGDGRTDLFFGSNQHNCQLYLNKGKMRFEEVSKAAAVPTDGGWTTGISVVDINNDGKLDVYLCRVGNYVTLHSKNLLLINTGNDKNGIPVFADSTENYGLSFSGFSTQAAFFDYDLDGDLDMFLLNHSVHENGTFRPRKDFEGTYHPLSGDRIFRNEGRHFIDVTHETAINSTAIGYGLGIAVSDINLDGYPDLYIGNDFHENDYLYINQKNGRFAETGETSLMHTSQFSMGVDVADITNDAYPEIISLDMLPSDPYILKRSLGEDAFDIFNYKISVGYSHQYTRNNLQYNRRNGMFSEVGLFSGVAATDWSWAPLWMDFDNDGRKDLFISNGIPKRMNDIDYINFVSNGEVQQKIRTNNMQQKDLSLIDKFPEIKLPNRFFHNDGDLHFTDESDSIENNLPSFSNGAAYADLDDDGDLDIIVNNIDAPVTIYENQTQSSREGYLKLKLQGNSTNINAIGSRLVVFAGNEIRTYEKFPVRGFLSSMEGDLLVGLKNTKPDSVLLIWPDKTYQQLDPSQIRGHQVLNYHPGLPLFNFDELKKPGNNSGETFENITGISGIKYLHEENHFIEFDREPLIPHMISNEGPALAVSDINDDGLQDFYIGASRDHKSQTWIQTRQGKFERLPQPVLDRDSIYEDVDAIWADVNNDHHPDLIVVSGGNEFYGSDFHNSPRVYLNNGKGALSVLENAIPGLTLTGSRVCAADINKDGYIDLFIGGRAVPNAYGEIPNSFLLLNEGNGHFKNMTGRLASELSACGFVTDARFADMDQDGDMDLVISLEWGGIEMYTNDNGRFSRHILTPKRGWWNFALPVDIDGDGDMDIIAGNLGGNSRLKVSEGKPLKMYYGDFDKNGRKEQILTYYLGDREYPFANKMELERQMPVLKKKFLYAENFAKSNLNDLFGEDALKNAQLFTADFLDNAILINEGNFKFKLISMPWTQQLSPLMDAVPFTAYDGAREVMLMGNYYDNNIEMGRYDADFGSLLKYDKHSGFSVNALNGLAVKGEVRHIRGIIVGGKESWLLARNSDSLMLIKRVEK